MKVLLGFALSGTLVTLAGSASLFAAEIKVPVAKDTSLIRESVCCINPAATNFGASPTVDAGQYHHNSRALFGFTLPSFDSNTVIQKAELVLPIPAIAGNIPASLRFGFTASAWNEEEVTWNNQPSITPISNAFFTADISTKLDITAAVKTIQSQGGREISVALDAVGQSNVFFKSKEADVHGAAYLIITTDLPLTINPFQMGEKLAY